MGLRGVEIDIELANTHKHLVAGQHTVTYLTYCDGTLWCIDKGGERLALGRDTFRFVGVSWFDTRITDSGRVSAKVDETWVDLGPMFAGWLADGCTRSTDRAGTVEHCGLLGQPGLDAAA